MKGYTAGGDKMNDTVIDIEDAVVSYREDVALRGVRSG